MRFKEMQLSEPGLDQLPWDGDHKKVIIATSPRSGSFMLCRFMVNAGLGIPHEYYNPIHSKIVGPRFGVARLRGDVAEADKPEVYQRYNRALLTRRTLNGIFAAKIQFWQFKNFLNNTAGAELFADAYFIHLYRDDVLGQAMSYHTAQVTGRWGFDETVTTMPNKEGDVADADGINRALNDLLNEDRDWRRVFAQNNIKPLEMSYEQLVKDPKQSILDIAKHIDYHGDLRLGYAEGHDSQTPSAGAASKTSIRENYIEKKRVGAAPLTRPG